MCNLVYFFALADGVGDDWYTGQRLPMELNVPGVRAIRSWRTLGVAREPDPVMRPLNNYHRMTEISFETLADVNRALTGSDSLWNPSHRKQLERFEGMVVGSDPEYDLIRDAPAAQYPYMSMPIEWSLGRPPEVPPPATTDLAKFIYFFGYKEGVDLTHAEHWYLGHHTREGKQLPGIQRYVTWKGKPTPDDTPGEFTTFVRYTELCFETVETWIKVCYEEGPKWVRSPRYGEGLWGNYKCFFIADAPDVILVGAHGSSG
jgi:hypothetical protein